MALETDEQKTLRGRTAHAAAAIEALHAAIDLINRAHYHLIATDVAPSHVNLMAQVLAAGTAAAKAHALATILAVRLP